MVKILVVDDGNQALREAIKLAHSKSAVEAQPEPLNELLGDVPQPRCSVKDNYGKHCNEKPEHFLEIDNNGVWLCDRCYKAYLAGEWG